MCPSITGMINVQAPSFIININLPNGSCVPVTGIGQVHLHNGLMLNNALCVPDYKFNLLFVSKLAKDYNCMCCFIPTYAWNRIVLPNSSNSLIRSTKVYFIWWITRRTCWCRMWSRNCLHSTRIDSLISSNIVIMPTAAIWLYNIIDSVIYLWLSWNLSKECI